MLSVPLVTRQNRHFIEKVDSDMEENGLTWSTLEVGKQVGELLRWLRRGVDSDYTQVVIEGLERSQGEIVFSSLGEHQNTHRACKKQISGPHPWSV